MTNISDTEAFTTIDVLEKVKQNCNLIPEATHASVIKDIQDYLVTVISENAIERFNRAMGVVA